MNDGVSRGKPSDDRIIMDPTGREDVKHLMKREFIPTYAKVFLLDSDMQLR